MGQLADEGLVTRRDDGAWVLPPRSQEVLAGWLGVPQEGPVDWSYLNHLVVNAGVIACTFGDEQDEASLAVLSAAYPGRRVVGVDARPLFDRGGGIHCITQQQPAP